MEKMVSEAKKKASRKYDAKTYKQVNARLRMDEDGDMIADLDKAIESGLSYREVLKEWYEAYKEKNPQ